MNRNRLLFAAAILVTSMPLHAQKLLSEGVKDLATQISATINKEKKTRIAVIPFRESGGCGAVVLI